MTYYVKQALAKFVVPLPSARRRGARNRNAMEFKCLNVKHEIVLMQIKTVCT